MWTQPKFIKSTSSVRRFLRAPISRIAKASPCWTETILLTVFVPLAVGLLRKEDPFLIAADFPWLVLVPVLLALHHGLRAALVSASLLTAGALGHAVYFSAAPVERAYAWAFGSGMLALVVGRAFERLKGAETALRVESEERAENLAQVRRAHEVLALSHRALEERVRAEWSLARSVSEAERNMQEHTDRGALAQIVLDVLATHAMVQTAAAYLAAGRELLPTAPNAVLGHIEHACSAHPMIMRARTTLRLVVLDARAGHFPEGRDVLLAIPLVSSTGRRCFGVVAIHELPFMAFHADHFRLLMSITGRLSDVLDRCLARSCQVSDPSLTPLARPRSLLHERERRARSTASES